LDVQPAQSVVITGCVGVQNADNRASDEAVTSFVLALLHVSFCGAWESVRTITYLDALGTGVVIVSLAISVSAKRLLACQSKRNLFCVELAGEPTASTPLGASAGHAPSPSFIVPAGATDVKLRVNALSFLNKIYVTPIATIGPAFFTVPTILVTSPATIIGIKARLSGPMKSNAPPGLVSSATLWANLSLMSHVCRFFFPPHAVCASLNNLSSMSANLGERAMLTTPASRPCPAAVAVTATTAAGALVTVGWLLTVVV
jgi:hypothetical protein